MNLRDYKEKLNELRNDSYIETLIGMVRRLDIPPGEARDKIEQYVASNVEDTGGGPLTLNSLIKDLTDGFFHPAKGMLTHTAKDIQKSII